MFPPTGIGALGIKGIGDSAVGVSLVVTVGERETIIYRFEGNEIKLLPRKTHNLDVDRRLSGQPAQSASEYVVKK
jgi:hypothetical protein